jgi:hypothetical protein
VQGAILCQAGCYWLFGSVLFTLTVFIYRVIPPCLSGEALELGKIWYHLAPMVVSSVVFLPVVMFSAVRFSHRFAGPMVRFRRTLKQFARGEPAPEIKLRRRDFWSDVANEMNQVSARLCESSSELESSGNLREMDESVEEARCV